MRLAVAIATLCLPGAIVLAAQPQTPPEGAVSTVVNTYCVGCHNGKMKAGNLLLNSLVKMPVDQHPEEWEKVVRKLRVRHMPPVGMPRPNEKTYVPLSAC